MRRACQISNGTLIEEVHLTAKDDLTHSVALHITMGSNVCIANIKYQTKFYPYFTKDIYIYNKINNYSIKSV